MLKGAATDFPLGLMEQALFHRQTVRVKPQDRLAMFTDGVIDASNGEKQRFGVERLCDRLSQTGLSVEELGERVFADLREFVGVHPQVDDMCR